MADFQKQAWWPDVLRESEHLDVEALARRFGVPEADLRAALVRGGPRRVRAGEARSRLDGVRHRLGAESDGRIAAELGIARKTVVEYRKRLGIAAWRVGDGRTFSGRPSKLDAHAQVVGRLPDREVALRAGVTPENVRMYRRRRGIPAGWRDAGGGGVVYRLVATLDGQSRTFGVVATDPAHAMLQATRVLSGWSIVRLEPVGDLLVARPA